jgi:hypothetical protein
MEDNQEQKIACLCNMEHMVNLFHLMPDHIPLMALLLIQAMAVMELEDVMVMLLCFVDMSSRHIVLYQIQPAQWGTSNSMKIFLVLCAQPALNQSELNPNLSKFF